MAENRNLLVSKRSIFGIIRNNNEPKMADKTEKPEDKLYISISSEKNDNLETTSPSKNISIFKVVDTVNNFESYSANDVKRFRELELNGQMPQGVSIEKESAEEFFEKNLKNQEISFRRAIAPRDNSLLGEVITQIDRAISENNLEVLGMMEELIKHDPNFQFLIQDGKINRNAIQAFKEQSNGKIKNTMDVAEKLDDELGDKFDSTDLGSIRKVEDGIMDELMETSGVEMEVAEEQVDMQIEEAENEQEISDATSSAEARADNIVLKIMSGMQQIRNAAIKEKAKEMIEDIKQRSSNIASKAKAGIPKLANIGEKNDNKAPDDKDNNSIENLFQRSNLSNKDSNKELEARARLEKERENKEAEEKRVENKVKDNRELNDYDRNVLERKDGIPNTLDRYIVRDEKVFEGIEKVIRENIKNQDSKNRQTVTIEKEDQGPEIGE